MYKVIVPFADACDDGHVYLTGDTYPRKGFEPTAERVIELASTANGRGFPVIEKVVKPVKQDNKTEAEPEVKQAENPVEENAEDTEESVETKAEEQEKPVEETSPKTVKAARGRPRTNK